MALLGSSAGIPVHELDFYLDLDLDLDLELDLYLDFDLDPYLDLDLDFDLDPDLDLDFDPDLDLDLDFDLDLDLVLLGGLAGVLSRYPCPCLLPDFQVHRKETLNKYINDLFFGKS